MALVDREHLGVAGHPENLLEHLEVGVLRRDSLEDEPARFRGSRLTGLRLQEQVRRSWFDGANDELSIERLELGLLDVVGCGALGLLALLLARLAYLAEAGQIRGCALQR